MVENFCLFCETILAIWPPFVISVGTRLQNHIQSLMLTSSMAFKYHTIDHTTAIYGGQETRP